MEKSAKKDFYLCEEKNRMMSKYCNCIKCAKNEKVKNPFKIYQDIFSLKEIALDFDLRVSAMCRFGCKWFGQKIMCPPNIPDAGYYAAAFRDYNFLCIIGRKYPYSDGFFFSHWRNYSTNEIHELLLEKEKELFKKGHIYAKAFIGGSCKLCFPNNCSSTRCRMPSKGRAPVEAAGINVFSIMKTSGLEYQEPPKDYFWRIGIVLY